MATGSGSDGWEGVGGLRVLRECCVELRVSERRGARSVQYLRAGLFSAIFVAGQERSAEQVNGITEFQP